MWMTSLTTHENSIVFGCKQQMAYEMRISDWSSDVCSSVLFSFALFASFADQKLYAPRVGFMVRVQLQIPEQAARHDEQRGLFSVSLMKRYPEQPQDRARRSSGSCTSCDRRLWSRMRNCRPRTLMMPSSMNLENVRLPVRLERGRVGKR